MPDQKWLDGYGRETTEELISKEGEYRTDSLVLAFEQAVEQKVAKVGVERISAVEMAILAVEALEREVNNGGYDQFFCNAREYASVIVSSLQAIGCPITADISQHALAALRISGTLSIGEIDKAMNEKGDSIAERLGECDDRYYNSGEAIADRLFAYIKTNKSKVNLK